MLDSAVSETQWREGLFACAQEVLETMFFTPVQGEVEPAPVGREAIVVSLNFSGGQQGRFMVSISKDCAEGIATNFLGIEHRAELAPGQTEQVAGELANMVCGAVLSRIQPGGRFDLTHPELVISRPAPLGVEVISAVAGVDGGEVELALSFT